MKLYKTGSGIVIEHESKLYMSTEHSWYILTNRTRLYDFLLSEVKYLKPEDGLSRFIETSLLPPIGNQEVWASGVTYMRSREARMEESKTAGGGDFYARVYDAARPELFFKATSHRVVGDREHVRIRKDSKWNVPEPELTLFFSSHNTIEGYTIGNDMSSRDIEGENPLYLPQAKCYDGSTALGPCLYVASQPIDPSTMIHIRIRRDEAVVFEGQVSISRMKRNHTELGNFLFREMTFPFGVYLMTGTGVVPPDHFSLQAGDEITISIDPIGKLVNVVSHT